MKELILWKEVPESNKVIFDDNDDPIYLKRVVINILSDQEIEKLDKNSFEGLMPRFIWKEGYKAMQERLIGGNI